jgi:hypothetical protein
MSEKGAIFLLNLVEFKTILPSFYMFDKKVNVDNFIFMLQDTGTYLNNERRPGRQQMISCRGFAKDRENDETALFWLTKESTFVCTTKR